MVVHSSKINGRVPPLASIVNQASEGSCNSLQMPPCEVHDKMNLGGSLGILAVANWDLGYEGRQKS